MTTTDLKAAAEAAKAATAAYIAYPTDRETGRQWDRACAEFSLACTEDAILALIRERDEWRAKYNRLSDRVTAEGQYTTEAELERLGNDLSAAQEEVGRLRAVMRETSEYLRKLEGNMLANDADMMLDDCLPPSFHADQIDQALTKETPHAE